MCKSEVNYTKLMQGKIDMVAPFITDSSTAKFSTMHRRLIHQKRNVYVHLTNIFIQYGKTAVLL